MHPRLTCDDFNLHRPITSEGLTIGTINDDYRSDRPLTCWVPSVLRCGVLQEGSNTAAGGQGNYNSEWTHEHLEGPDPILYKAARYIGLATHT